MREEQIRAALDDRNLSEVARATQLHVNTIYRFMNGLNVNRSTVKVLGDYVRGSGGSDANA